MRIRKKLLLLPPSFAIFLSPFLFSYIAEINITPFPAIVQPNSSFFLRFTVSRIEEGHLRLDAPKCIELNPEEIEIGTTYDKVPFLIFGKSFCSIGRYTLKATLKAKDCYFYQDWKCREYEKFFYIPVFSVVLPSISYSIENKDYPFLEAKVKDWGKGVEEICLEIENREKEICLERFQNEAKIQLNKVEGNVTIIEKIRIFGFLYQRKREIRFNSELKPPSLEILKKEIGKPIEISTEARGIICLDLPFPLISKTKCKPIESNKVSFDIYPAIPAKRNIFYINLTIYDEKGGVWKYRVPLIYSSVPNISIFYSGIDFKKRSSRFVVINRGNSRAKSIIIREGKRSIIFDEIPPSESKYFELPYKDVYYFTVNFSDEKGKEYSKRFVIYPDIVYFKERHQLQFELLPAICILGAVIAFAVKRK